MSDRCEFEVTDWRAARTLVEKGASLSEIPRWPAVALARPGTCIGCEREGSRAEKYTVRFADAQSNGAAASCEVSEARWRTFAKGSKWKGKVRVLTGGLDCDGLTRL